MDRVLLVGVIAIAVGLGVIGYALYADRDMEGADSADGELDSSAAVRRLEELATRLQPDALEETDLGDCPTVEVTDIYDTSPDAAPVDVDPAQLVAYAYYVTDSSVAVVCELAPPLADASDESVVVIASVFESGGVADSEDEYEVREEHRGGTLTGFCSPANDVVFEFCSGGWQDGRISVSLGYYSETGSSADVAAEWLKPVLPIVLETLGAADISALIPAPPDPPSEGPIDSAPPSLPPTQAGTCDALIAGYLESYAIGTVTLDEVLALVPPANRQLTADYAEEIRMRVEADPGLLDLPEGPFASGDLLPALCAE